MMSRLRASRSRSLPAFAGDMPASVYYAGVLIVIAMLIGGGTEQALWTDHLIELCAIPGIVIGFGDLFSNRLGTLARLLAIALIGLCLLQFIPWGGAWPSSGAQFTSELTLFSPAPGRSLEASLYLLAGLGFFLFVARLNDQDQERLVYFILIGFFLNVAIGLLQLSAAGRTSVEGILPYEITSAAMTNENHFSTMVFSAIPLIAWRLLGASARPLSYFTACIVLVVFLFAVGSRAGMAASIAMSILSLFWFFGKKRSPNVRLAILGLITFASAITAYFLDAFSQFENDGRITFFRNTWNAILDFFPGGSGLGTFRVVYPYYEPRGDIVNVYANQAHNDFLQITLETGIAGVVILSVFFFLMLVKFGRSKLSQAAMLSIIAITVHSVVDYPLRTFAIAIPFAFLAAVILTEPENPVPQLEPNQG